MTAKVEGVGEMTTDKQFEDFMLGEGGVRTGSIYNEMGLQAGGHSGATTYHPQFSQGTTSGSEVTLFRIALALLEGRKMNRGAIIAFAIGAVAVLIVTFTGEGLGSWSAY